MTDAKDPYRVFGVRWNATDEPSTFAMLLTIAVGGML
jgi:hypothetical protein